jgi:uncharacterized protein (TIGR03089 family)
MGDAWSALQARKRTKPGVPLVTYLNIDRGERVELSGTTVENAAAKIANALRDEFDLEPGATVALRLPVHWQRAAWLAGAWTAGCVVALDDSTAADLTVVDELSAVDGPTPSGAATAVSLHPFGLPITAQLPPAVQDATIAVRTQPDAYLFEPPNPSMAALTVQGTTLSHDEVWLHAQELARDWCVPQGGVLLVLDNLDPLDAWTACLAVPLVTGGSVVLAVGPVDLDRVTAAEQISAIAAPRP